ncbi:6-carboxytetrahydropterin synthase QueD [Aquiflexum gelatinilyticum]|uniref:6-carboxy-5,6,7,8-tetrahydropterin synthase n=1 Tax=Aquiflexum gelatinilyticum TaxID=2961943 RepID=A0A9X2P3E3_9BACT|nr:6-carboxytetrahydropterin synthase QueD [Aquiflexum gelatinilyticum]MCR9013876.1 6-carboxytetrahydropterin synthase QueD [Aquiflexum gelatinilyticum]
MLSITKIFSFEAAHRISNYQGSCSRVHGHSYKIQITVTGKEIGEDDMLIDFKVLKDLVNESVIRQFDHSFILQRNAKNINDFSLLEQRVFWMDYEPTAERMVLWMVTELEKALPVSIYLRKIVLFETETSFVTWESVPHLK